MLADALRCGQPERRLPQLDAPAPPAYALCPHGRQLSPRVRVCVQWLKECFAGFG